MDNATDSRTSKPEQCLEAARGVFTRQGYGAASMDGVAEEAGVSKATVYAHFGNKQGLFAAMMRRECQRCMERMAIPDDVHQLDLETALRRIAARFLEVGLDPDVLELMRTVIAESPRFTELGEIFYSSGPRVTLDGVVTYLDRVCAQGLLQIVDTETAATQFLGMLRGDLQMRALMDHAVSPEEISRAADGAVTAFLQAYRT